MLTTPSVEHGTDGLVSALVRWRHRRGGQAHCLVRLVPGLDGRVVAVVSELSSNPAGLGIADDFPGVAAAVLQIARAEIGVAPQELVWVAHHGAFSYPDAFDPDSYTLIPLTWDGTKYHDHLHEHRVLPEGEVRKLLAGLPQQDVTERADTLQRG